MDVWDILCGIVDKAAAREGTITLERRSNVRVWVWMMCVIVVVKRDIG